MTTELVPYNGQRDTIDGWVQMLPAAVDLARHIHMTEFVPKGMRDRPAAVCAAILAGRELGLAPMQSLQHVVIVEGRPSLSAEMQRALVVAAGHELRFPERSNTRCTIAGRRRGQEEWTNVTFTMDDAKRAHLDGKNNWRTYPRHMLTARASSELCELMFPDVVGGIACTEVMQDIDPADRAPDPEPPKRTAQRRTQPQALSGGPAQASAPAPQRPSQAQDTPVQVESPLPDDAPALPGEEGYDTIYVRQATHPAPNDGMPEVTGHAGRFYGTEDIDASPSIDATQDAPPADPPSNKQYGMLNALFAKHGIEGRPARRDLAGKIIGRELASQKEMSKEDASVVIDTLQKLPPVEGEDFTDIINRIALANITTTFGRDVNQVEPVSGEDHDVDLETGEVIPPGVGTPQPRPLTATDEDDYIGED